MRCSNISRQRSSTSAWRRGTWCHRSNTIPGVSNVTSSTYRGWRRMQSTVTNTVSFLEQTSGINRSVQTPCVALLAFLPCDPWPPPFHRVYPFGEPDMALHRTMCLRLEDGNSPTWGWCNRGEESQSDSQVSTEHIGLHWCATLRHAGTVCSVSCSAFMLLFIDLKWRWSAHVSVWSAGVPVRPGPADVHE